ncbi:mCpol domain-containing protein [Leptolyngbya sp. 'hensonii']|uniref:mCpol domain-containing protein n=1 Tax=Leptolyngbya sp. 'hensonii' TaxID=1922337 RepID=UPI0015C5290C|nr:mCpol domain-containing protein [Leptolyngbya sp. 'hensonii']
MYAFFDGDNIGSTIEILLTEGQIEKASNLSKNIQIALTEIEGFLKSKKGIEIIILGGDDILISYSSLEKEEALLEDVKSRFLKRTGNTMSCGVSENLSEAIWNLHLAKLYGKNMIKGIK